ncbi:MAG: hypothetical protein EPN76_09515 [Burkholderiaceae bacterium]|nr:MAG: hypothetical protein EPN76_09515 [Burkholderiaceae bacterium]TAM04864.1 MAG: hypothetical protein EPN67_07445 [Pusillimonas sp.]
MTTGTVIEPYDEAIGQVDAWLAAHGDGYAKKAPNQRRTWILKIDRSLLKNKPVRLILPPNFPAEPAGIYVDTSLFLELPHVERDGHVCLGIEPISDDYINPISAVLRVIQKFENEWFPQCQDASLVEQQFNDEALSYWNNFCTAQRIRIGKSLAPSRTYVEFSPISTWTEGSVASFGHNRKNQRQLVRQIVSMEKKGAFPLAKRHGWNTGSLIRGHAIFIPLPEGRSWTPKTWPTNFTALELLVGQLTSDGVHLTSWLQRHLQSKNPQPIKDETGRLVPEEVGIRPLLVFFVQNSVLFGYQLAPGFILKNKGIELIPISPTRIDSSWSLTRDHAPTPFAARRQKKVLVIGCGSLGSPIVELLARAGVGILDIIDSENFESPNTARHVLGLSDLEQSKAKALEARLRKEVPEISITGYDEDITSWITKPCRHDYDLIVECSGESYLRTVIAHWRAQSFGSAPVLHAWVEPFCSAAHAVLTPVSNPWPAADPADELVNAADFSGQNIRIDLPACGAGFHPYGAADVWQAASFVTERILATLDGRCTTETIWSWVRSKAFYDNLAVKPDLRPIVPVEGSSFDSVMLTRDYRSLIRAQ